MTILTSNAMTRPASTESAPMTYLLSLDSSFRSKKLLYSNKAWRSLFRQSVSFTQKCRLLFNTKKAQTRLTAFTFSTASSQILLNLLMDGFHSQKAEIRKGPLRLPLRSHQMTRKSIHLARQTSLLLTSSATNSLWACWWMATVLSKSALVTSI